MNTHVRTRLLAVVAAGTLTGVLGGAGLAFAGQASPYAATVHPTATCGTDDGAQAEGKWYGQTMQSAR